MGTDRQTDRQTDMTKLIVAFRNFANASNNPRTGHESPEGEYMNKSILSLTSALDGVGG